MKPYLLLTSSLLAIGARATYSDASSDVVSAASVLNKNLDNFKGSDGINGALNIQVNFPALSSALGNFAKSVDDLTDDDLDVQATSHLSNELSKLLDNLSSKAADFASVGAAKIATNDLEQIATPAGSSINGIIKVLSNNQSKWNDLSSGIINLESKINHANSVYSVTELQFAPHPTFGNAAATTSSSPENLSSEKSASASVSAHTSSSKSGTKPQKSSGSASRNPTSGEKPIINSATNIIISGACVVGVTIAALLF